jgi:uncharacterized membrane protein YoaK (UPF0700 family)
MQSRKIILIGGCGLAFGAAFANTGVLLVTGTSISHLTGDISKLSMDLARSDSSLSLDALRVAVAAMSFTFGAILAGYLIHHPSLDTARPYGRTISGIGFLFVIASLLISRFPVTGIALAAFGCGIQNSIASHYRGIILRTTHLTGLMTDFGITLGMKMRGYEIPTWKVMVPALLAISFFLGGLCSSAIFFWGPCNTILIAGVVYCLAGIGWSIAKHFRTGSPVG